MQLVVQVKKLRPNAVLPAYGSDMAAGLDLHACIDEPLALEPGQVVRIPTGIAAWIGDRNYAAVMYPRSGLGTKGLVLGNLTGLIDADYQGEISVVAWNRKRPSKEDDGTGAVVRFPEFPPKDGAMLGRGFDANTFVINPGDRIAQLMFVPVAHPHFIEVAEFTAKSSRGEGGFGSTGVEKKAHGPFDPGGMYHWGSPRVD